MINILAEENTIYLGDCPLFRIFSVLRKNREILLHPHWSRNGGSEKAQSQLEMLDSEPSPPILEPCASDGIFAGIIWSLQCGSAPGSPEVGIWICRWSIHPLWVWCLASHPASYVHPAEDTTQPLSVSFAVLAEKQIEPAVCCHGDWGEPHSRWGAGEPARGSSAPARPSGFHGEAAHADWTSPACSWGWAGGNRHLGQSGPPSVTGCLYRVRAWLSSSTVDSWGRAFTELVGTIHLF